MMKNIKYFAAIATLTFSSVVVADELPMLPSIGASNATSESPVQAVSQTLESLNRLKAAVESGKVKEGKICYHLAGWPIQPAALYGLILLYSLDRADRGEESIPDEVLARHNEQMSKVEKR